MSFTERELIAAMPGLKGFALTFIADHGRAEDLVQETLMKAWVARDSFQTGTNLRAWLFTILRNVYFSQYRKIKREVELPEDTFLDILKSTNPSQEDALYLKEVQAALARLPIAQRKALTLVRYEGRSYEEAAAQSDVAVGTIKSRVHRATIVLQSLLDKSVVIAEARHPTPRRTRFQAASTPALIPPIIALKPRSEKSLALSRCYRPIVAEFLVAGMRIRSTVLKRVS